MIISIVIVNKNDLSIVDTIRGLNKQDYQGKYEIIVVDRSSIDYPKFKSGVPLRWIIFDPKGKRYTIPEQRNRGIKEAKGDIIVFLDASCIPETNWLTELVNPIKKEEEKIVMGKTGSIGRNTLNDLIYEKLKDTIYVDEAPTINLALDKVVFDKTGYFDEKLEYGSDIDFTWRAIDKGYKIRYQQTAFVKHNWGDGNKELKRTILYGKGRTRLLIKHFKTRWTRLFGNDSIVILYPIIILCLPIAIIFPWYLLVFPLLVLKNIKEPNSVGIVLKHIIFGFGVLIELKNQLLN
jgi:GT2 family glycosyltransferase